KISRIGFMSVSSREPAKHLISIFFEAMREPGWVEGRNLFIEWRWAEGMVERHSIKRRSEEHTSELQSPCNLVCRRLLEKKKARAGCCLQASAPAFRPPRGRQAPVARGAASPACAFRRYRKIVRASRCSAHEFPRSRTPETRPPQRPVWPFSSPTPRKIKLLSSYS